MDGDLKPITTILGPQLVGAPQSESVERLGASEETPDTSKETPDTSKETLELTALPSYGSARELGGAL